MAIRRTAGMAIFLLLCGTQLANAEWNAGHWTNFGRWWGFGFGDGYHSCPCVPNDCGIFEGEHHVTSGGCASTTPRHMNWQASRIPAMPKLTDRAETTPQPSRQVRQPQYVPRRPSR